VLLPAHKALKDTASRSWYLDPIVARQKQQVHLELVTRWTTQTAGRLLKTDLFEEGNGADQLLFDLRDQCAMPIGLDHDFDIVARARKRCPSGRAIGFLVADVRSIPFKADSVDVLVSSSTLDHFSNKRDFELALQELGRVLRPGGVLILTLDNPLNPLYWPLRWLSIAGPFRLGYTPLPGSLRRQLARLGFEVMGSATLLHNPRVVSTLLFLAVRSVMGRKGDAVIRALLNFFALFERLPTRRFTCCFNGFMARKPRSLVGTASTIRGFVR
jgi:SAM-dependent methyltransferase